MKRGKTAIDATGGPGGSPCGRFSFSARLSPEDVISWGDSYPVFSASAKEGLIPAGSEGVLFNIKPVGFSFARVSLRRAAALKGNLDFSLDLDQFILE